MAREHIQKEGVRYGQTVRAELVRRKPELKAVLDKLGSLFDEYVVQMMAKGFNTDVEFETLILAKKFLEEMREEVQHVTDKSMLENFDCVTQSIIACVLADRAGFETSVGHPKELKRHFHAFIVRKNGTVFEMVGRKEKKPFVVMRAQDAVARLNFIYQAYQLLGVRARRREKERRSAGNN